MKELLSSLLFLIFTSVLAQNYIPIDSLDHNQREHFITVFENSNKELLNKIKTNYKGKMKKELFKNADEFAKDFSKEIKDGQFSFDKQFTDKANEIFNELKNTNPLIPKNTRILISKNPTLNAYCLPDGTFVINMGLFYWLKNSDQIAGVIAHEIGHEILDHSIKVQLKNIDDKYSNNTKKSLKKLKYQKYNRSEKAFQLFKDRMYAHGNLKRKHELEADSLGYLILRNSRFNNLDYIETLRLSQQYDSIKPSGLRKSVYKKIFDLPNQKFNEDWLKMENFSSYNYSLYKEKLNLDSISGHPETEERINRLETLFPELVKSVSNQPDDSFKQLSLIAEYEQVSNMYFFEQYGLGIYTCLLRLDKGKDDVFYKEWLGKLFERIYFGRKNYKLNRYLDRVDSENQSLSYQQFLNFMWNLDLNEIMEIQKYYSK